MAQDATYQVPVYIQQGGHNLRVGSSGVVTIESGGSLNIADGGFITESSGGQIARWVNTSPTTTANMDNSGHHVISATTAAGVSRYILSAPNRAGLMVTIHCDSAATTDLAEVKTTACTIGAGGSNNIIAFSTGDTGVVLVAATTAIWHCVGICDPSTIEARVTFGTS